MIFKPKIEERKGRISVTFDGKVESWKRLVSQLINDNVVLDSKNTEEFLKKKGNEEAYEVFHFYENGMSCDFTLLRHGIFSVSKVGEPFLTYGHVHEREIGEAYSVIRNDCFFEFTDKKTLETFIVHVSQGDSIFIHPRFMHRIISHKKDCLVFNFVPEEAGHDYNIIKNKGFPVHLIYHLKDGSIVFVRNERYGKANLKIIKKVKVKMNPMKLFKENPERLKDILKNPEKYKKFYF